MQIEQVSALERRVQINLPMAEVAGEVEQRLKRLSRTVKMQGFRPGKVPLKLVAQNYGYQVQNDVMSEKINAAVFGAIEESKLRIAGQPRVEPVDDEAAKNDAENAHFVATFEIYPEVTFGSFDSAEVERAATTIEESEVDKTLEILRKQRQTFAPVTRASQAGDQVKVDFVGRIDGVEFEGGKAEGFEFVLADGRMLPQFDEAATGLSAGDTKVFDLEFPADYQGKDVAGKTAEFTITVQEVKAPSLPEIDGDFARQLGVEDGDLAKMREDIRANLTREVNGRLSARNKDAVMNTLMTLATFEVPKSLVDQDIERLREMAKEDLKQRGIKTDSMPLPDEFFRAQAEKRVRLGLAIAELVKHHNLKATNDQIRKHLEEFSKSYEDPASVIAWYYSDRKRLADVEAVVLENNVVEWVLANAKVVDREVPFEELMNTRQQAPQ
ncbi:trigger factor [soil metagenome]